MKKNRQTFRSTCFYCTSYGSVLCWYDNRRQNVGNDSGAGNAEQNPHKPDNGGINMKELTNTSAHTANHTVAIGSIQPSIHGLPLLSPNAVLSSLIICARTPFFNHPFSFFIISMVSAAIRQHTLRERKPSDLFPGGETDYSRKAMFVLYWFQY
jgi:hypothetical protein